MANEIDVTLTELEQATDHVIQLIVNNNTAELEKGVIQQVQLMKKLSALTLNATDQYRLRKIKERVEQQQTLISQALDVTNLFLQALHELSNFNRMG